MNLPARGAAVAVNYSGSKAAAEKVVAEIKAAGGKAVAVQADLSNPDAIGPFVKTVADQLGPIDILVNNAGVYEFGPLEQISPAHFNKMFNLNVLGLLLTTKEAVARFNPDGGSVINIGSVVGRMAFANARRLQRDQGRSGLHYSVAGEGARPQKIRVNALNPGMIETEGTQGAGFIGQHFATGAASETPLGRIGQPQDIATARHSSPRTTPAGSTARRSTLQAASRGKPPRLAPLRGSAVCAPRPSGSR